MTYKTEFERICELSNWETNRALVYLIEAAKALCQPGRDLLDDLAYLRDLTILHPAAEWTEADGEVIWHSASGKRHLGCYPGRIPSVIFRHWSRIPVVNLEGK